MNEKWTWLPDFASDMGIWEDDLVGIAPDAEHVFVAYEKMVSVLDDIYGLPDLAKASCQGIYRCWMGIWSFCPFKECAQSPQEPEMDFAFALCRLLL